MPAVEERGERLHRRLSELVARGRDGDGPIGLLARYLADDPGFARFDGRRFEIYGGPGTDPDRILPADLVAATLLSMEISRTTRSGLRTAGVLELEERQDEVGRLLARIPVDRALQDLAGEDFEAVLGGVDSPAQRLFELFATTLGAGPRPGRRPVAAHKLLARKRPKLFPIRDGVAQKRLGLGPTAPWWRPWWEALQFDTAMGSPLRSRVKAIREAVPGAAHLSDLRVLDVVIWMGEEKAE